MMKKRASNPIMALFGLTLFVLMIIVLGQNQLFFLSRLHSFITSTPHAITDHSNHGGSSVQKTLRDQDQPFESFSSTSKSIINCDRATLGLMSHGFMNIDPKLTPSSKTLIDFHKFLATTYGAGQSQPQPWSQSQPRPRLVLASRGGSVGRLILNQDEVKLVAEQIGFEVILFEPRKNTSLHESFGLIHSSHAMIGVHGAALTHALFLRPSSIFIQIVPIGAEGVSDICFGKLSRDMELVYEEYKIGVEESSLMEKFGKENSLVLKNPKALQKNGWSQEIMDIYLREQNINLDLNRFRIYLEKAYRKSKVFMAING
ncbi:hypothetical protein K7X08_006568 [Anisodus acutangulus]|uniref:Glycosyltransferase 61 catalytic domain-containing protein n=1 Tax=Anisodus acutangulus TaxID=402998 RepID=A0A9Q1MVQ9_9SOLA|nr:hypothetical protein K7X08_006568 [Anisodus acutangulus]